MINENLGYHIAQQDSKMLDVNSYYQSVVPDEKQ